MGLLARSAAAVSASFKRRKTSLGLAAIGVRESALLGGSWGDKKSGSSCEVTNGGLLALCNSENDSVLAIESIIDAAFPASIPLAFGVPNEEPVCCWGMVVGNELIVTASSSTSPISLPKPLSAWPSSLRPLPIPEEREPSKSRSLPMEALFSLYSSRLLNEAVSDKLGPS